MSTAQMEARRGVVYTFYSFKGGAGRTMALANVAALMAKWGRSVLIVDWDLEAPGVERFFTSNSTEAHQLRSLHPGITDLLNAFAERKELDWQKCVVELDAGVSLITAGRDDGEYSAGMQRLDFEALFEQHDLGSYIERLRTE